MNTTPQELPNTRKRRNTWLIVLISVIVVVILGCVSCYLFVYIFNASTDGTNNSSDIRHNIIVQNEVTRESETLQSFIVTGEVKNLSSVSYRFVKVRVRVYDAGGNQIGDNYSYIDSDTLPPGAISTFTVYVDCNINNISKYSVVVED